MTLKELQRPSIASLRAIAALRSPHLSLVRPARIGLGFESAGANQKTLAEVEDLLGGPGRLALPYSLRWLLDAITGLGVLHRSISFVHGEVQPEHIVLGEDGVGRLIPVVRPHWARGEERTPERLYYLAPEKLLGDTLSPRSDVFSVGVMLWEALAGQRMLEETNPEQIIARLMAGSIPRVGAPEGEVWTLPLADIAARAIAVDPGQRFASIAELKEALERAGTRHLAGAPGMAELFARPMLRARKATADLLPPLSQRVTVPPMPSDPDLLDAAAERLSRNSFHDLDLEDEVAPSTPAAPEVRHTTTLLGGIEPQVEPEVRHTTTLLGGIEPQVEPEVRHTTTLLGGIQPQVEPERAVWSAPPTAAAPLAARADAETDLRAFDLQRRRGPSLAPFVASRAPQALEAEPEFELLRPRKRRAVVWLLLAAAAAVGAVAERPWLARQFAAATGATPDPGAANGSPVAIAVPTPAPNPSESSSAARASDTPTPAGGAGARPSPDDTVNPKRPGQRRGVEHVVIHDSLEPAPATPAPATHVEAPPEPPARPAPRPPSPKPAPPSNAVRYGI